ncbi:MAG: hypothetical protein EBR82_22030 [Caulobacteraceae bacterium]|nr:hypothetical protein [Caulobacteraceae bacterium]
MAFEVPSEVPLATLTSYQSFENNVRFAVREAKTHEELRQKIERAISILEETFCPQPEEKK